MDPAPAPRAAVRPGRRVLITGAASGLGAALTRAFAANGDEVLPTDRTGTSYDASPAGRLDVTSDADWAAARAEVERRWGGLDVLVNNAGIAGGGRLDVADVEEWRPLVEINLLGTARGIATFTPVFKRQRSGIFVNIASLAGLVHPAGMASYNAVKAGVVALSETAAHELAAYGVRSVAVCPSYFRTNLLSSLTGKDTRVAAVVGRLVEGSPLTADDMAAAILRGLDDGGDLIVPDPAAQAAWDLKQRDRAAYDAVMRAQAAKLEEAT